jgi:hypothetical protein
LIVAEHVEFKPQFNRTEADEAKPAEEEEKETEEAF